MSMDIGGAVAVLKRGGRVARSGWNGKGMWLKLVAFRADEVPPPMLTGLRLLPWVGMKTADDGFVPWLCSQTDLLAEDWVEVTEG